MRLRSLRVKFGNFKPPYVILPPPNVFQYEANARTSYAQFCVAVFAVLLGMQGAAACLQIWKRGSIRETWNHKPYPII